MKYTKEEILSKVDHTLLKPEATWPQIQALCDDAIKYHTASVCINTCYVKQAVQYMAGRVAVCCVVGFPLGAMDTASKCFEAKTAVENGAEEVDMVINIGRLKNKEYDAVREDIAAVKRAVGDKVLKVIIETCLLTDEEKRRCAISWWKPVPTSSRPARAFLPQVQPSMILSCLPAACAAAARSRQPAAFPPLRTWKSSWIWAQTVWAPPALLNC